ncbi:hypothetical protein MASR2M18_08670 [Ignavibacteria bacterium]|nr:GWxTD domain-containing protein [Bacteroidota bacterium]MCZ2133687.1 GWxTD domain-containing protein [Bacteroidota bacterium]
MKFALFIFLFSTCFLLPAKALPQGTGISTANTDTFMAEAFSIPDNSPDSGRIHILFRIRLDMLSFRRTEASPIVGRGEFAAFPKVSIEIRDSVGIIRGRTEWSDSVFSQVTEADVLRGRWISGTMECKTAAGRYTPHIVISERNSGAINRVKLAAIGSPPNIFSESAVIFARVAKGIARDRIEPVISNNDAPFESEGTSAVIAVNALNTETYTYTLTPVNAGDWLSPATLTGTTETRYGVRLVRISSASAQFPPHRLQFETITDEKSALVVLTIRLPENSIAPGQYRLTVSSSSGDTLSRLFRVKWENAPASFGNVNYAIELMRHILSDKEYGEIGESSNKRRAIIDYWRKLDPTPFTVYNEAMSEYFRRADVAAVKFSTLAERSGALSERGKVYMLYGWPDYIEHPASGKGIREIWTYYKREKKHFIFEQNNAGIYRLIQIAEN